LSKRQSVFLKSYDKLRSEAGLGHRTMERLHPDKKNTDVLAVNVGCQVIRA